MATKDTTLSPCLQQITSMVKASVPIIWVTTHEEDRFIAELYSEVIAKNQRELWTWSAWAGLRQGCNSKSCQQATGQNDKTNALPRALDRIIEIQPGNKMRGCVFVMKDMHIALAQPVPRQIRDMYEHLTSNKKTLLIVAPFVAHGAGGAKMGMEPTLDKLIKVIEYDLPSKAILREQTEAIVEFSKRSYQNLGKDITDLTYTPDEINTFVSAIQGLTIHEAKDALCTCIIDKKKLDERALLKEKKQIIRRSEILEYIEQTPSMDDVGGLDEAKRYFSMFRDQFTPEAEEFGVEPLRGVMFVGVPGAGKSLLSKAVAAEWKLPILRLDVGKVMSSLVGSSEEKMRQVITQAEAVAPAILWIDEVEKSLSGTKSSSHSDGGTIARVFGTLLTAMEERLKNVVTIATANDIQALPPELIRRFNEVLFVDLPVDSERKEIFKIHLQKRKRDPEKLNLEWDALLDASRDYTGSEIEKAVKEAIVASFRDGKRQIKTGDILQALKDTKPISKVMAEKITEIRKWARGRARYASSLAAAAAEPGKQKIRGKKGKEIDLDGMKLDEVKLDKEEVPESNDEQRIVDILEEE